MILFFRKYVMMIGFFTFTLAGVAYGTIDVYEFDDAEKEEDFRILIQELRCPKCQNQNIADSNAGLAKDIKDRTYKLLKEGKTRSEITEYMVERYGEFITYRPPVTSSTWVLWFGPAILLLFVVAILVLRRLQSRPEEEGNEGGHISQDQSKRVKQLLDAYGDKDKGDAE